ncbi:Panacea domain-containing protein [Wenyingzhuangia sp. IMCC45574]
MKVFNYKKSVQAVNLFANLEGREINYTKAIKLIWLSDRYYLRNHGKTITGDKYFALKNGPLASCTSDIIKAYNLSDEELSYREEFFEVAGYILKSVKEPNLKVFSKKELEILKLIYKTFSNETWDSLSNFSHIFPEWKVYEDELNKNPSSRYKIDMNMFFKNVVEDSGLFQNSSEELEDLKKYHQEFFSQYCY